MFTLIKETFLRDNKKKSEQKKIEYIARINFANLAKVHENTKVTD